MPSAEILPAGKYTAKFTYLNIMIFHIAFQVLLYAVGILFINKKHKHLVILNK